MNKTNKIVLSLVMGLAMNQSFTSQTNDAQNTVKKDPIKTVAELTIERKNLEEKLPPLTVKEKAIEKALCDKNLDDKARAEDKELKDIRARIKNVEKQIQNKDTEIDLAWKETHTILATISKYATGIGLGGFLITKFELSGKTAMLAKYGSLATIVAATIFVAAKGYEYFFEEEIDEDVL